MKRQLFALLGVIALVGAAVGPAMAAASGTAANASAANAPLAIGVTQDGGVTVAVTANGSGVANASVDVATVEANATYAGTGSHTTGANGTVGLPSPNESVAVSLTATEGNRTAETTTTLVGTVDENESFGQQVSSLVHALQASTEGGIGEAVSSWVTANNPGNAPAHAGGPGGPDAANATANDSQRGPPAFVQAFVDASERMENGSEDAPRGPPAHAGGPDANESDDEDDERADGNETADENETDDDRRGPPEDAGPDGDRGNGNGNGQANGNGPANAGPSDDADEESTETDA